MKASTVVKPGAAVASRRLRAARQLALDHTLAEIAGAFGVGGVDYLLLKGRAFAEWLYRDDVGARAYGDIDLLPAPGDFTAAEEVLADLGFRREYEGAHALERATHHDNWVRDGAMPARVELHHTLYLLSATPQAVWGSLSPNALRISVGRAQVRVPSEPANALIVALHAAQHGAGDPQRMEDLRRALGQVELPTWCTAAGLARELGSDAAFASGLRLVPSGAELAGRLSLPTETSRVLRLLAGTPPDTAVGIERLVATRGLAGKLRLVGHELAPSAAVMRGWRPLARRGGWGLALAYLWRPWWLAAKLPAGLRAWLRAARSDERAIR